MWRGLCGIWTTGYDRAEVRSRVRLSSLVLVLLLVLEKDQWLSSIERGGKWVSCPVLGYWVLAYPLSLPFEDEDEDEDDCQSW